ncbi:MAG: hypothetical protein ACE5JM_06355 [Armatimonadota bacterium]
MMNMMRWILVAIAIILAGAGVPGAAEELEPVWRGDGNLLRMAHPEEDWCEVRWEEED